MVVACYARALQRKETTTNQQTTTTKETHFKAILWLIGLCLVQLISFSCGVVHSSYKREHFVQFSCHCYHNGHRAQSIHNTKIYLITRPLIFENMQWWMLTSYCRLTAASDRCFTTTVSHCYKRAAPYMNRPYRFTSHLITAHTQTDIILHFRLSQNVKVKKTSSLPSDCDYTDASSSDGLDQLLTLQVLKKRIEFKHQ